MRLAVVLFNLGGPDSLAAVRPFLRNLFLDRAIIDLPDLIRRPLAGLISSRRAKVATEIYRKLGGSSPILPQTKAQAEALKQALARSLPQHVVEIFVSMRYWHPMAEETARAVAAWRPDRVVLLPLYPQLSSTTTSSSVASWRVAAKAALLDAPTQVICCYALQPGFIEAAAALIGPLLDQARKAGPIRLLLSAHGLPEKIVARGDPYPWHIERSARAIVERLGTADLDWAVCYQSRVGPMRWIGPATEQEIARAARDGRAIVLFPVSFVSEHSETLVELDMEYAELAHRLGVPAYHRVPTVGTHPVFIDGLANLVGETLARPQTPIVNDGSLQSCGAAHGACPRLTGLYGAAV